MEALRLFDLAHAGKFVGVFEGRAHFVEVSVHALGDAGVGLVNGVFLRLGSNLGQECRLLFAECRDSLLAKAP